MDETEDDLIMCEDSSCKIIWFHFKYMCIKKISKEKWFCPECWKKERRYKNKMSETFLWFNLLRSGPTK